MSARRGLPTVRGSQALGALVAVVVGALSASPASAQGLSLTTRTIYHAYQLQLQPTLADGPLRNVNRFYQTLDASGFGLAGSDLDATLSLRFLTDLGTGFGRDTPAGVGVPGISGASQVDLLFAYADWRDVIRDRLDLRFGRQLLLDDLDWYVFDGLKLTGHLYEEGVDHLDVELYAGLPVLFDVTFSSDALLNDGVQQYDGQYPLPGLVLGGAAFLRAFDELSASVAYRQEVQFRGDSPVVFGAAPISDRRLAASASAGTIGLQESRVGGSVGYTYRPANLDLYGHATWDLLVGALEQARGGVSYNPNRTLHFGGEYLRVRPRFAGDSIFNFFNIFPYDRGRLEVSWQPYPGLMLEAGYLLQVMNGGPKGPRSATDPGSEGAQFRGSDASHGPSAGVSYRSRDWGAGAYIEAATNANGEYAFGGNYRFGYLFGDLAFLDGRLVGNARLSFTTVQTDWFEGVDQGQVAKPQTSYNANVGARWQLASSVSARLNLIKNFGSPLEGSYRVLSELVWRY